MAILGLGIVHVCKGLNFVWSEILCGNKVLINESFEVIRGLMGSFKLCKLCRESG